MNENIMNLNPALSIEEKISCKLLEHSDFEFTLFTSNLVYFLKTSQS